MKRYFTFFLITLFLVSCSGKEDKKTESEKNQDNKKVHKSTTNKKKTESEVKKNSNIKNQPDDIKKKTVEKKEPKYFSSSLLSGKETVNDKPVKHYKIKLSGKDAVVLISTSFPELNSIKGYTGSFEVQGAFDKDGNLIAAGFGKNAETPEFMERIKKEWLGKLENTSVKKPLTGKGSLDALSEATISTMAIKNSLDAMRKLYLKNFKSSKTGK
ncbi:MAG: FMN-binding protein [Deltaproteobacteria bacterium]|nr:FMN-binding protein [Deltaproteobacteria bacterium]